MHERKCTEYIINKIPFSFNRKILKIFDFKWCPWLAWQLSLTAKHLENISNLKFYIPFRVRSTTHLYTIFRRNVFWQGDFSIPCEAREVVYRSYDSFNICYQKNAMSTASGKRSFFRPVSLIEPHSYRFLVFYGIDSMAFVLFVSRAFKIPLYFKVI